MGKRGCCQGSQKTRTPGLLLPRCNSICKPGSLPGEQCPCLSIRKATLPIPIRQKELGDLSGSMQLESTAVIILDALEPET